MHVSMVRLYRPEIYRLKAEEGRRCCGVETGLIALFCCVDDSAKAQIIARELRSPDLPRQHVLRLVDKHRKIADENQRRQNRCIVRCIYRGRQIWDFVGQPPTTRACTFPYEGVEVEFSQLIFQLEADNLDGMNIEAFVAIQDPYVTGIERSLTTLLQIGDSPDPYGDVLQETDNVAGCPLWVSSENWALGGFMTTAMARHIRQRWPA